MTIIDIATIEKALNPIADAIAVCDGYDLPGDEKCFAVQCEPRNYTQLMIEIAALDPRLATDMHDAAKDVGGDHEHLYYFPGFELELIEGPPTRTEIDGFLQSVDAGYGDSSVPEVTVIPDAPGDPSWIYFRTSREHASALIPFVGKRVKVIYEDDTAVDVAPVKSTRKYEGLPPGHPDYSPPGELGDPDGPWVGQD